MSNRTGPKQRHPAQPAQGGVNREQRSPESGHSLVPKPNMLITQTPLEDLPVQLSAWRRLWAILLTPVESQSASPVNECAAKLEDRDAAPEATEAAG